MAGVPVGSEVFVLTALPSQTPPSAPDDDPFLDVFEAAAIPKVHPQTVREAYRGQRLRGVKLNGSRLRFRRSWVIAWVLSGSRAS